MKASKMKIASSIFKTFFLSLCVVANTHFAFSQTAAILPPAKTTFVDQNGKPLTLGTVDFYIPGTTTRKTTWQDAAKTIPNTNPVVLDGAGRAIILGDGSYRQVVKDRNNNSVWDQVTSSVGSGGSGGNTIGDGLSVGTIVPWAGIVAPVNYQFSYGQELSRTTYSALFQAITYTTNIVCTSGNPTVTLTDTTSLSVGAVLESACTSGNPTIISKTPTSVTLSGNALVTVGTTGVFFPYGNGNGTTTFNVPDTRGYVLAGRCNMGGADCANLTSTYFSTNSNNTPSGLNAKGGAQSQTMTPALSASLNYSTTFSVNPKQYGPTVIAPNAVSGAGVNNVWSGAIGASPIDIFSNGTLVTTSNTGGIAVSATIANGGSGYTNGSQTLTLSGGTCSVAPQFTVTVVANVITAPVLLTPGLCSVSPTNPAATTGGGGTSGTLNVTYSAVPFSKVQPTVSMNYVIKTVPDVNLNSTFGVASIGGMTGIITCGTNVTCTGNSISVILPSGPVTSIGGMTGAIICGNGIACSSSTVRLAQNNAVSGQYVSGVDASGNITRAAFPLPSKTPLDYGAVCDGATNDSLAIQAWLDAIRNYAFIGQGVPGATCMFGNNTTPGWGAPGLMAVHANTIIRGNYMTLKLLNSAAGSANAGLTWYNGANGVSPDQILGADNVDISELNIDGNRANQTNSIASGAMMYIIASSSVKLRNNSTINGRGDGLYTGGSTTAPFAKRTSMVDIDNHFSSNNYRTAWSLVGVEYLNAKGGIFQSTGNTNANGTQCGIDMEPDTSGSINFDITMNGLKVLGNNTGGLAGSGGICAFAGASAGATTSRTTISNIIADSNGAGGNGYGVVFNVGGSDFNDIKLVGISGAANPQGLLGDQAWDRVSAVLPTTKTSSYTLANIDTSIIFNCVASCTLTLPAANRQTGRSLMVKTIAAFTVVSASSNIVPLGSAGTTTAILSGVAGRYVTLQSDGTNWVTISGNP